MSTDHRTDPVDRAQQIIEVVIERPDIDPLDTDEVYNEAMILAEETHCYAEVEPYLRESTKLMQEQKESLIRTKT